MKLALISPVVRDDLQSPLVHFDRVKLRHFYFRGEFTSSPDVPTVKLKNMVELERQLNNWGPDLIQAPEPFYGWKWLPLFRLLAKQSIPYFLPWLETRHPRQKFGHTIGFAMKCLTRKYVNRAEFLWPVTPLQKQLIEQLEYETKSIDPDLWGTWGAEVVEDMEATDRFSKHRFFFLGRLEPEKGIQDLLKAWPAVYEKTGWKLDIAGIGSLRDLVREQTDRNQGIRYLGFVPWESLEVHWKQVSVLVSPSRPRPGWEEQVGMSNLQAMGRGVPVISTWSGAIPFFIQNKENGLLTFPNSPRSLARLMIKIASDQDLYLRLSKGARQMVKEHWQCKQVIHRAEARLHKLFEQQIAQ